MTCRVDWGPFEQLDRGSGCHCSLRQPEPDRIRGPRSLRHVIGCLPLGIACISYTQCICRYCTLLNDDCIRHTTGRESHSVVVQFHW